MEQDSKTSTASFLENLIAESNKAAAPYTGDSSQNLLIDVVGAGKEHDSPETAPSRMPELPLRREKDSLDDFEHLAFDSSPLQETAAVEGVALPAAAAEVSSATRDLLLGEIDKGLESAGKAVANIVPLDDPFEPSFLAEKQQHHHQQHKPDLIDKPPHLTQMDSNLMYQMGAPIVDPQKDADEKLDKFLSDLTHQAPSVPSHEVSPLEDSASNKHLESFVDAEREFYSPSFSDKPRDEDRYSYDEPKQFQDAFNKEKDSLPEKFVEAEFQDVHADEFDPFERQPSPAKYKESSPARDSPKAKFFEPEEETFKDTLVFGEAPVAFAPIIPPSQTIKKAPIEPSPPPTPPKEEEIKKLPKVVEPPKEEVVVKKAEQPPKQETKAKESASQEDMIKPALTDAEAIFKKLGLVESLIYWRDPKKSGPVFGGVLIILLALTYLSLISVVAYVSLLGLLAAISFRIYKNVVQAVQKTGEGHPFKELLESDITLPQDKVKEIVEITVAHINAAINELRRLFLVEDLVDSIKFGVLLWCLTYLGAWFNGMTLVIIAWVALFTLPKVYETNKTQIDANLDLVRSKLAEITSKVKAAIPIGKKNEEKKEQ